MTDTPADILVVEDDPDLRALLLDELTDAGHTCAGCGDLSSAQGFMREQMPKLVLSDLHLPDGNGLTLLEILKPLPVTPRSEEHTSELQSRGHLVCRLLLEKKREQVCKNE